ncbi:MAG: hypothetical protein ACI8UZ_001769 [Akkermansiaceae bacterium]|jgi:hypothetical protein
MKHVLAILFFLFFSGCTEEPFEIRVETWHEFDRSINEYRNLQPDRPILVFYTADWDMMGQLAQKYVSEPRFFELFTRFRVLPLIADCTEMEGIPGQEFQRTHPEGIVIHCFLLSRPSQEDSWFPVGVVSSDSLYNLIKGKLEL